MEKSKEIIKKSDTRFVEVKSEIRKIKKKDKEKYKKVIEKVEVVAAIKKIGETETIMI